MVVDGKDGDLAGRHRGGVVHCVGLEFRLQLSGADGEAAQRRVAEGQIHLVKVIVAQVAQAGRDAPGEPVVGQVQ